MDSGPDNVGLGIAQYGFMFVVGLLAVYAQLHYGTIATVIVLGAGMLSYTKVFNDHL
jgi:hypothetical protein